jgi:transposase-like protein
VRLSDDRPCLLVIIGTLEDGTKELVGIWYGQRESKLSWTELLINLKSRGLSDGPNLCVGDGALGFWLALEEQFPISKKQRCWVHKMANVLDKMPKKGQPSAKAKIHQVQMAETKENALQAFDEFMELYKAKYPKACECLRKDKDVLFTFYDFPAQHWVHIRTTNPIESSFATVRHRTKETKGCGSRKATLTMVFKLGREAEKRWRKINGYDLVPKVIAGIEFKDGIELSEAA